MRAGLIALICVAGCGRVGYAVLPQSVADATVDPGADGGHVGEMDSGRDAEADAGDVDGDAGDVDGGGDAGDVDGGGDAGDIDGGGDASIDLPCGTTVFFHPEPSRTAVNSLINASTKRPNRPTSSSRSMRCSASSS